MRHPRYTHEGHKSSTSNESIAASVLLLGLVLMLLLLHAAGFANSPLSVIIYWSYRAIEDSRDES